MAHNHKRNHEDAAQTCFTLPALLFLFFFSGGFTCESRVRDPGCLSRSENLAAPPPEKNPRTDSQKRERPPAEVESIPRTLDGRAGNVCVWKCVSKICKSHYMKKVELLIMPTPSGDPLLRGSCSACPDVKFAFVGNTEENRRLMQLAFERHVREVHMGESGNQSDSP